MRYITTIFSAILLLFSTNGCQQRANSAVINEINYPINQEFNDYWFSGTAEITSYTLSQSRYGEVHDGEAVLVFVTEPFSKSKQVKLDYPARVGEDKVPVMKMNFTKKFNTGIYPYSMMLSSFTPIDAYKYPHTIKTTVSIQEWCGQVYTQLNLNKEKYNVTSFSYFESEGDKEQSIKRTWLEDELWNRIRLDFKSLPTGEIDLTPGLFFSRLRHEPIDPQKAQASLKTEGTKSTYSLEFPSQKRELSITFESTFPHKILSWEETYIGLGGNQLTTKGTLKKSINLPYWSKHSVADLALRDSLGLTF